MLYFKKLYAVLCFAFLLFTKVTFSQGINVSVTPANTNIANFQTVTFQITVTPTGGFNQQIFFNILSTNLPAGHTATFSQNSLFYPYASVDTLTVSLNNVNPSTFACYLTFQVGNGPVQVTNTVNLKLVGSFCSFNFQTNLPVGNFNHLVIDNNNVKWFWSKEYFYSGLVEYDGVTSTYYNTGNSSLPSNGIRDVAVNKLTNDKWIATLEGLAKFDGTFWTVYTMLNSPLPTNNLKSVAVDSNGVVWIGAGYQSAAYEGGLIKFDGTNWQFYNFMNSTINRNQVRLVRVDRLNHIWVASDDINYVSNLSKFDGTTWTEYSSSASCFQLLSYPSDIAFDHNNVLWIAAGPYGGPRPNSALGLIRFDETTWEVWNRADHTPFNHHKITLNCQVIQNDNSSPLPSENVTTIVVDNNNVKWFSLNNDQGPYDKQGIYNFNDSVFTKWDKNNSVFNIEQVGVAIDNNDDVWAVKNNELFKAQCSNINTSTLELRGNTQLQITIVPNPSVGQFQVYFPGHVAQGTIQIINSMGANVFEKPFGDRDSYNIQLKNQPAGIYFVIVSDGTNKYCKKLAID